MATSMGTRPSGRPSSDTDAPGLLATCKRTLAAGGGVIGGGVTGAVTAPATGDGDGATATGGGAAGAAATGGSGAPAGVYAPRALVMTTASPTAATAPIAAITHGECAAPASSPASASSSSTSSSPSSSSS